MPQGLFFKVFRAGVPRGELAEPRESPGKGAGETLFSKGVSPAITIP